MKSDNNETHFKHGEHVRCVSKHNTLESCDKIVWNLQIISTKSKVVSSNFKRRPEVFSLFFQVDSFSFNVPFCPSLFYDQKDDVYQKHWNWGGLAKGEKIILKERGKGCRAWGSVKEFTATRRYDEQQARGKGSHLYVCVCVYFISMHMMRIFMWSLRSI